MGGEAGVRRLASFFDSVGPAANLLYWLSLWWMGIIALLFAFPRLLLQDPDALSAILPSTMFPGVGGIRNLLPFAHVAAFFWLALVGWAARNPRTWRPASFARRPSGRACAGC